MTYLEYFDPASERDEAEYVLSFNYKVEMTCFAEIVYPFKIFPEKYFSHAEFAPITVFYGGNGSGKSTFLNIVAEKLGLIRKAPFNRTPYFEEYLSYCRYGLTRSYLPSESRIITSDEVFDFLLDMRAINDGVDRRREEIFSEYEKLNDPNEPPFLMRDLSEYDELRRHNEARHTTKNKYAKRRLPQNVTEKSNGESAFRYFTSEIKEDALYLLDEPENSLSAEYQLELARFLKDSARFYGCQFIIATHSPFILSMKGAKIYDLDARPVCDKRWTELPNVRVYRDFFRSHEDEFK